MTGFFASGRAGTVTDDGVEMVIPAKSAKSLLMLADEGAGAGVAAGGFEMNAKPERADDTGPGVDSGAGEVAAAGGAEINPNAEPPDGAGAGVGDEPNASKSARKDAGAGAGDPLVKSSKSETCVGAGSGGSGADTDGIALGGGLRASAGPAWESGIAVATRCWVGAARGAPSSSP